MERSLYQRIGEREGLMKLLRRFYADVRQHQVIGPVFNEQIKDWPAHMEVIADFWSGATGGPATYRGGMPFKHMGLKLEERHFAAWLELWRRHCSAHLGPAEAEAMIGLAENIGRNLRRFVGVQPSG